MLLTSGCASLWSEKPVTPGVSNDCAWAKRFIADPGWETRFTVNEKRQITVHNEDVKKHCR